MPYDVMGRMNGSFNYLSAGVSTVINGSYYLEFDEKEGINRMSMLFCKLGGGCITAIESGQTSYFNDIRYQRVLEEVNKRRGKIEDYKIDFVLEVFPLVLEDERKSGIPAEITFAQMCIESAYGKKTCVDIHTGINGNNYFGIKGNGPAGSVSCKTTEEINGNRVPVEDSFRAYNSMEESIEDHSKVLVNNYQQYITTGSVEDWCGALQKGGYATASNYKDEILGVCKTWNIIE